MVGNRAKNAFRNDITGFLSRLAKDQAGNTIAILAAAIIPVIGLVGGSVDVSRIYLAQARLQGACDSGALMGRKVMGPGSWEANSNDAEKRALSAFDQNFEDGAYGTTDLNRSFREESGNVVGQASVTVPMALMQVLGIDEKTITVGCQAELRIPNTDVMFVLDTTGSMANDAPQDPSDTSPPESKISGLRKAVKCFYEALSKQNIDDISPEDCGETEDPNGGNVGNVQLRFGFVPYSVNVNVGRLLPLDFMADQWTYQSREAMITNDPGGTPTFGTESAPVNIGSQSQSSDPSSWSNVGQNVIQGGNVYDWRIRTSRTECDRLSPPNPESYSDTGNTNLVSQTPDPLVYPEDTVTRTYATVTSSGTKSYRYNFSGSSRNGWCTLQSRETGRTETTALTQTTIPVTWNASTSFSGWTYKPVTFNVSALKDTGNNSWRTSLALPVGNDGQLTNIYWPGCIEERQTYRPNDNDPSNDWDPIPASAKDMNIDLVPDVNDVTTQWAPMLPSATWQRYEVGTRDNGTKFRTNNATTDDVWVGKYDGVSMVSGPNTCPAESRLYQTWTPTAFKNYVNGLNPNGNTYHDIGLLWGARLMSPTGIFSSLTAPDNLVVERHMVFMTDGDTVTSTTNYSAYGNNWWDRRQTQIGTDPTTALLTATVNARTEALCKAIKAKNITLWVVSYGAGVNTDTTNRLRACASPGKFFEALSVSALVTQFKGIAAEISALRLTQ